MKGLRGRALATMRRLGRRARADGESAASPWRRKCGRAGPWLASALLSFAAPLHAQRLDWHTRTALYADNTEFFTPYRVGETIMGGQLSTWIAARYPGGSELRIGVFGDHRSGSEHFTDSLKPIIAFRHVAPHSLGVVGTLETVDRHGLLEPIMVTTRELTTPIEYGGQWIENRRKFHGEAWINWQKLNLPNQREQFEMGTVLRVAAARPLDLGVQHLWYHRGGQLYNPTPVTNNHVVAVGATLHDSLGSLGRSAISAWGLWSYGNITPYLPASLPGRGHGVYLRASVTPWNWAEVFAIHWVGRDFSGDAGDNNYNSTGSDQSFYQSHRVYTEIGMIRKTPIGGGVTFDAEWRFHNIDNLKSIAFFDTRWEISYRLVVRAPIDIIVRH